VLRSSNNAMLLLSWGLPGDQPVVRTSGKQ
jgi:hypothetical protein